MLLFPACGTATTVHLDFPTSGAYAYPNSSNNVFHTTTNGSPEGHNAMAHKTRTKGPELIWEGKYDENGELNPVDRTILPFQVVETVNESKADREKAQRDLFTKQAHDTEWRNMLVWGDNKVIMSSLLPRLAGKINLIYIDPPFATGQDFSYRVRIGDEEFVKEPSIIEQKAYRDTWGRGLDSYLQMIYERLVLIRELLADDGSIFVHLAPPVSHTVKLLLDEVLGSDNFRNEVVLSRPISKNLQRQFQTIRALPQGHDVLLWYSRSESARFRPLLVTHKGKEGGYWHRFWSGADRPTMRYPLLGETPTHGQWKWKKPRALRAVTNYERYVREAKGRTLAEYWHDTGQDREFIRKSARGTVENWYPASDTKIGDTIWTDVKCYENRKDFATQKHRELLRRIIALASDQDHLVADFFCGSGTTGAVAEKLGRRWIMCDLSKWAIQVTRKRLLQIEGCGPFEILNLGNYERHKLAANGVAGWERYVNFILDLYRAEPVSGFKMLHGTKARASVHVGSVDSPITMREIRETLNEAKESGIREVHFLGWDFEMGLHDLTKEIEEDYGVKPRLISIPKEALEVKDPAKEQVRFFDLNYLELAHSVRGKTLTVTIKDFIIANPEYIPDDVREGIRKFTDYIDYWAVDCNYHDDTFHNGWQSFRTRKNPKLETKASHTYNQSGTYKVLVKVVDIFGNDTTKLLEVRVR